MYEWKLEGPGDGKSKFVSQDEARAFLGGISDELFEEWLAHPLFAWVRVTRLGRKDHFRGVDIAVMAHVIGLAGPPVKERPAGGGGKNS